MFFELHILQNFAPSNLNRDDSNAPKDCVFGGFRRARISSQCIKRSIRKHGAFTKTIQAAGGDAGIRTKRLIKEIIDILVDDKGAYKKEKAKAQTVAENILKCLGIGLSEEQKTEYLLYVGKNEITRMIEIAIKDKHWSVMSEPKTVLPTDEKGKKKPASTIKKEFKTLFPKEIVNELESVISKDRKAARAYAPDIALFGRMLADDKDMNVDAACQVAHAISTNEVEMKMDFYTAVDDLLPDDESGSDMMGFVEFNSSCYYRYSLINLDILKKNLGNDNDMVKAAVVGFLKAAIQAVPTGMQNSTAAQNQPSYIRAVVRSKGAPWSLANAFIQPVRPGKKEGEDLMLKSIKKLEDYFKGLKDFYEDEAGIVADGDLIASMSLGETHLTYKGLIAGIEKALAQKEAAK